MSNEERTVSVGCPACDQVVEATFLVNVIESSAPEPAYHPYAIESGHPANECTRATPGAGYMPEEIWEKRMLEAAYRVL